MNVLRNSPNTSDLTNRDVSQTMCLRLLEIYDKSSSMVTAAVFNTRQHDASTRVF